MSKPILRIHNPDSHTSELEQQWRENELDRISGASDPKKVAVPLGKVVPLLLDAAQHQRAWLDDFSDDLVNMDADLYDILLAYQQIKRRSAA
ncbi:hypothetical protein OAL43_01455 [bacterium]|jgi:hypothetical protein|nr:MULTISPECIES: hypothetical protein [Pirellulaceae]MDB4338967.1 hypothetical protein [Rubripirellula sp.]MDB4679032.1 hypothetical protein [Rhodopirellula sp.]MDC0278851.1 hypothetical protein [bacterium]